jgi:hypothetical protein
LKGEDKPHALRQALLVTMKSHPYPGDWAGFVLIGEPSSGKGLATVSGNSPELSSPSDVANEAIPVPAGITFFREGKQRGDAGPSVIFMSGLSINELLAFYRSAYAKKGFKEDTALTHVEAKGASIVLAGKSPLKLVVQITANGDSPRTNFVSVGFEPIR